jgi:hypothetical protein
VQNLHQEKTAQALSRIVQCSCGALKISGAGQFKKAVPQIFPPQENKNKKEND